MPGRSYTSDDYRYGFNGMEKDDEVKGAGNSLDFGARIYDARIGRWLTRDPLEFKYPSLSPYSAFANDPIIFKDPNGEENVIYLTDLSLTKPNITREEKEKIMSKLEDIAALANQGYKSKGLTPRVVVIDFIPGADELKSSDVLATLGTEEQLIKFDTENADYAWKKTKNEYDIVGAEGMGPEESTTRDGSCMTPENLSDEGNRIALELSQIEGGWKEMKHESPEAYAAWLIQHGSGHNAGAGHSGEEASKAQRDSGEGPDMMTDGQKHYLSPDKGVSYRGKVGPNLKAIFTWKKFTENPAKDELQNKPIED